MFPGRGAGAITTGRTRIRQGPYITGTDCFDHLLITAQQPESHPPRIGQFGISTPEQVRQAKQQHPEAQVIVHPECQPEVIALADAALSTSQMISYAKASPNNSFIIGTEEGLLHPLRQENPGKSFYLVTNSQICTDMKKTTLEVLARTMEQKQNIITVHEEIRIKAKQAVDRMLAVSYQPKTSEVAP